MCQTMLSSVEYNRTLVEFAQQIAKDAIVIKFIRVMDNVTQYLVHCQDENEKYQAIQNIYGVIYPTGRAVIFCHVFYI